VSQPVARVALGIAEVLVEMTDQLDRQEIALDPYLSSTERVVELFLDGLTERLDEPWTLNRMAESCGLGRTRFVHYCKQVVNVAPQEYLADLRLRRAAEMLHRTDLSISQIALRCGFQTSQYFSTVFRRRFGCTPGASRGTGGSRHAS
jgi:AraC family L-rhamnose operon regulatory protein RhaS